MKQKDIIMEAKSTTYDTLPERIDYLISEIREVKELLTVFPTTHSTLPRTKKIRTHFAGKV